MDDDRKDGLVAWQWASYRSAHRARQNLLIHAFTVPLFLYGSATLPIWLALRAWPVAGASFVAMIVALASQGKGHAGEESRPVPFRGALDVVARFFTEQWVNFPRFVVSGAFARAWRAAGTEGPANERAKELSSGEVSGKK